MQLSGLVGHQLLNEVHPLPHTNRQPLVSAVIPTRNRPSIVCRAVRSALNQTYSNLEVVVVVDGPDEATVEVLQKLQEPRLRIVALSKSVGGSEARNVGIREAHGEWIALLDDDDEWLPQKLEKQVEVAVATVRPILVATRYEDRTHNSSMIQPRLAPRRGQHISDYLFTETSLLGFRSGFLQTSTWLAAREVFLAVPFTSGLPRNQDTDWLLRAVPNLNLELQIVWEKLAIFHNDPHPARITGNLSWRQSFDWASSHRQYFTKRSYAFFLATVCTYTAERERETTGTLLALMIAALKQGSPTLKCMWLFIANWFIYPYGRFGLRRRIENLFPRVR